MTYPPQQPGPQQPEQPYQPPQPGQPYPQQPYPQQPGAYPQPVGYPPAATQPKKGMGTGKVLLIVLGGLIGLCCVGGVIAAVAGGGNTVKTTSTSGDQQAAAAPTVTGATRSAASAAPPKQAAEPKQAHPKLGQPARDGKFEFVVQKINCGVNQVGDQYLNKTAQGQFCLVSVSVKNISNQPQMFDGGNQKAIGASGAKYDNDSEAETYANKDTSTFLNNINPGNTATGTLVFDIPAGASIKSLELHDSMFSGGVTVDVG